MEQDTPNNQQMFNGGKPLEIERPEHGTINIILLRKQKCSWHDQNCIRLNLKFIS